MRLTGLPLLAGTAAVVLWFVGDVGEASAVDLAGEPTQALPEWRVEVVGECRGVHPKELDASCRLLAVSRAGQEIYFSLEKKWLEGGQLYLEDLLEQVTLEDLVAIYAELVLARPSEGPPDQVKEDGPDLGGWRPDVPFPTVPLVPLPPGPQPSEHPSAPPLPQTSPQPSALPWPPPNKWSFPVSRPRHRPMTPTRMKENGVDEADLRPWPPMYPGTNPSLHNWAWPEAFRCDGRVWSGYRSDCPDFAEIGLRPRWERTMQAFWKERLFNGGKNPGCSEACAQVGHGGLVIGALAGLGCFVVTSNLACLATVSGSLTLASGGISGAVIDTWLSNRCQEAYCDAK
jgi:hypothetical protein